MTNPLLELKKYGQSVWYDDLNRKLIVTGALQRMVDEDGVSGGTSNPSIFEKAISGTDAYDEHLRRLVDEGRGLPEIYDELTTTDVRMSTDVFRPIYDETQGADGFASLEVSPLIANNTQASIEAAQRLFGSRVDTLTDRKLEEKIAEASSDKQREELRSLLGKAGIANAKIAYAKYKEIFSGTRWKVLADAGARVQRCLWASTSTKNPEYRDVMYAEGLIGPDTINTMPQSTLDAFREHGVVAPTLEKDVDEAFATIERLEEAGISFKAVTDELQVEGVRLFSESFAKANES